MIPSTEDSQIAWLNEIFPGRRDWNSFVLAAIFQPESLGKKAGRVIEQQLRPVRNSVAHALLESTGELSGSIDNAFNVAAVDRWAPLAKCIARHMLKNEFPTTFSSVPARPVEAKEEDGL